MRGLGLSHFLRYAMPLYEATDKGGSGGGASDLPETDDDIDKDESLDEGAKAVMKKERAARRDAARAQKAAEQTLADVNKRLAELEKEKTDRAETERKAAEKAQEESGQYKELAERRERERDEAKEALKAVEAERDALKAAASTIVKSDFDSLPDEIKAFYSGAADDPVAQLAFVPKAKELAAKLTGESGEGGTGTAGVVTNPPNRKPSGDAGIKADREADEAHRAANAQRYAY